MEAEKQKINNQQEAYLFILFYSGILIGTLLLSLLKIDSTISLVFVISFFLFTSFLFAIHYKKPYK